jgi:hypothetical protein
MKQADKYRQSSVIICNSASRTTIALQIETKKRLDGSRAPGQCYDEFVNELVGYWERYKIGSSLCGPGKPVYQTVKRENLCLQPDKEQHICK